MYGTVVTFKNLSLSVCDWNRTLAFGCQWYGWPTLETAGLFVHS